MECKKNGGKKHALGFAAVFFVAFYDFRQKTRIFAIMDPALTM